MKRLKIRPRYLLVFSVVGGKKYKGFYTPQKSSYSDHFEMKTVWIADMGEDCRCVHDGVGLGAKCYLLDIFELDTKVPFKVMQAYGSKVDFKDEILEIAKDVDGDIEAFIIHENALLGIEEDTWKKNPKLSWDNPKLEAPLLVENSSMSAYH